MWDAAGVAISPPLSLFLQVNNMLEGKYYGGFKYRNRRDKSHRGRNSILGTIITAIAGTVIKDLSNKNSKIKKLFSKAVHSKQIENEIEKNKVIDTEYSLIDDENKIEIKKEIEKK